MRSRYFLWVSLLGLCLSAAAHPRTASAALRSPQVPVLGGVLQGFLASLGESINVNTDQDDRQRWASPTPSKPTFTLQFELARTSAGVSVGLYNAGDVAPEPYPLFPVEAGPQWFTVASFRTLPARVVINVFDANAALHSTTTYMGANKDDFAFYLSGPGGVFHTQDARNPGGQAQWLVYAGTGINAGNWWLAGEASSIASGSSDQGYDDVVVYMEANTCACSDVQRTSWAMLKSRFR